MRRPINNGVPFQLKLAGDLAVVFNAKDFDPNYVYLVTLDAWVPPGETSTMLLSISTGTPAVAAVQGVFSSSPTANTALNTLRRNVFGPTRIMDRFACRGDQVITALAQLVESAPIMIWGFFERAGIAPMPLPMRPLQPTNDLQTPFNAPVTAFSVAPGSTVKRTLHLFDAKEERLDYLWLSLYASYTDGAAVPAGETVVLKLAGVDIELAIMGTAPPFGFTAGGYFQPVNDFFDGLPLKAQGSNDKLEVEVTVPALGSAVSFYADGRFFRS